jgi:hypothetical protein
MKTKIAAVVITFDVDDYHDDYTEDGWEPFFDIGAKEVEGPGINGTVAVTFELPNKKPSVAEEIVDFRFSVEKVLFLTKHPDLKEDTR